MSAPPQLSAAELSLITDPAALLERAWALEPGLRLSERGAALVRLERLLDDGAAAPEPPGRAWRLELLAERAIDAAATVALEAAAALADRVLADADAAHEIAIVRALFARGRVLAWTGTEASTRRADRVLLEVAERCRALGSTEWQGSALFWRANSVFRQNGELAVAVELMDEALEVLGPDSPRRASLLTFRAETLSSLGELEQADALLGEATELAERDDDPRARAYAAWSRAVIASVRDALLTERLVREVERDATDWFQMDTGVTFLADAAEMLDRVGLGEPARTYLARARERDPDDEFVRQARATLLARSGDPIEGLDALQQLAEGAWLEKRLVWRHTLLAAWATFRAGRDGAGELAARALEQAHACGGEAVASSGEPELVAALAPLAEPVGSAHARELLLDGRSLLIRLFGAPSVTRADGTAVELPPGKPGALVRMLALHERGLPVEVVLEALFPDAPTPAGRQRLRQVLTRLRAAAGELVLREDDSLRLVPAWVDVRAFIAAADRVRGTRGPRAVQRAYAALALHGGPLLPGDRYAEWTEPVRELVEYRHLDLLDRVARDAAARGSHQEALTALDAALESAPRDADRSTARARALVALGRNGTAEYLARRSGGAPGVR